MQILHIIHSDRLMWWIYVRDLHSCWICCSAIARVSVYVSATGVLVHRQALYISLGGTSQLTTCKLIYNQYLVHIAALKVTGIFYLICMEMYCVHVSEGCLYPLYNWSLTFGFGFNKC